MWTGLVGRLGIGEGFKRKSLQPMGVRGQVCSIVFTFFAELQDHKVVGLPQFSEPIRVRMGSILMQQFDLGDRLVR